MSGPKIMKKSWIYWKIMMLLITALQTHHLYATLKRRGKGLLSPQCKFLVMKEKNIFVYKLFLLLNNSDLRVFLCKNCNPPRKKSLPLSQQPPSKNWDPVHPSPPPPPLGLWTTGLWTLERWDYGQVFFRISTTTAEHLPSYILSCCKSSQVCIQKEL